MRRYVFGLAILGCAAFAPLAARGDDQQIAQAVMQKLAKEKQAGNLKSFGIELKVDAGTVYMKGRVASPEQQKLALECAQHTSGVKQVVNELAVNQPLTVQTISRETEQVSLANDSLRSSRTSRSATAAEGAAPTPAIPQVPIPEVPAPLSVAQLQPAPTANLQPIAPQYQYQVPARQAVNQMPRAFAPAHSVAMRTQPGPGGMPAGPVPQYLPGSSGGVTPAQYDHPQMPGYAWPSYASHPNYAAVTYPKQYSPTAWPYIGPFYPYPQVPLGWRKVTLEWDDGWWMLDFQDR